ncbi:serine/threonine-protein kinase [Aestuariirhabdus litorea]|uniref:non-specific serine/threonine protein kinase n=1 Tax=Aestuariirhabdus litorea TaxID=2528527 RepID=A0A3P3VNY0_9GAMM|nr:serine/threonine-protein kinase [Aestuariirhabdus litorea]RRJ84405.1 serine/threonine protein kinase [Aestuariirhabdus litorea]RWW97629.1 serine/threonine protein kinase [Endozoicomonadaceae bacterium GTF-13]
MKTLITHWLLALFSTRFLVCLLAGAVASSLLPLERMNQQWLEWSSALFPAAETPTRHPLLWVTPHKAERDRLQAHPLLASDSFALLQQHIERGGRAALLLPAPPLFAPDLLQSLGAGAPLMARLQQIQSWQKASQLIIGTPPEGLPAAPPQATAVAPTPSPDEPLMARLSRLLSTPLPPLRLDNSRPSHLRIWPTAAPGDYGYPLLYQNQGHDYPSVLLVLARGLNLDPLQGLSATSLFPPGAGDGRIFPRQALPFTGTDLEQAALAATPRTLLIIDATESAEGEALARALLSLQQQHYLRSAPWGAGVSAGVLVLILAYLLLLMPLLSPAKGALASLLLGTLLAGSQLALQPLYGFWIPIAEPLLLLLGGSALMMIQLRYQQDYQRLQARHEHNSLQLGSTLYHQGKLEEAATAIAGCRTNDELLGLTYDIALQQEKTRDLLGALGNYRRIQQHRRQFKDVGQRIDQLSGKLGETQVEIPLATTQTLMLPEQSGRTPHLGRYEVIREIGRGAMGVVYLGRDPRIARTVAIKTLTYDQFESSRIKEMKSRFFREAEAAGRLNHPSIVTIFDMGEEQNLAFIAMDYAKGEPLNRHCKGGSLLPVRTVYRIVAEVADALSYAHRHQIVHRDIKPGNIMFDADSGEVKVTDFGIARISDDSQTKTGSILGSPLYMSPEQIKGAKVSGTADIYSLGVTFYQLLTGEVPFNGDNLVNLTHQIINSKYKSVRSHRSDLPASATRIVNKALQKEAGKRYQDAAEMAEALRKSLTKEFVREPA